jgi:hypothetical protein
MMTKIPGLAAFSSSQPDTGQTGISKMNAIHHQVINDLAAGKQFAIAIKDSPPLSL